ncbi:hypothetical protein RHODGE_RHODGE_03531 [Rhodoplanes serenus]|uniref:Uncharacterized protein n=1 Tax=Rhodoplanes serenus TaxID=200615 RepID=A0A3S4FBG2_9BRAD|nr:DUF6634 family protein [Rhodoplanes serenus]VCU10342.1 hypothetical protein RHODGE_RHODGE_03531 [Rhodoplanes serenus]
MSQITHEAIETLRRLVGDLERIHAGQAPTAADLANAPLLDPWLPAYTGAPVLTGTVTGHPRLGDRPFIATTPIYAIDPHRCWVRTWSRFYRLGFEAGQPGGRA